MSLSVDKSLLENYASYYHNEANFAEWRQLGALDKCDNILRLCSNWEHQNILEIGCGDGAILERLANLRFASNYTGLEISASGVRAIEKKNVPGVRVQLFDGYQVPFVDKDFDLAILTHVLEHVEYPRRLIHEASRVAKTVFVEVPLEDNLRSPKDFVFDRVGHINSYNVRTIRHLVQSCDMKILHARISHSGYQSYFYRKGKVRGSLSYILKELALRTWPSAATNSLTYHYSLVCTSTQKNATP
jgi:SAM-dependent methyltransferase